MTSLIENMKPVSSGIVYHHIYNIQDAITFNMLVINFEDINMMIEGKTFVFIMVSIDFN